MPRNQPGPKREDDRRIISGILHVITPRLLLARLPGRLRTAHHGLHRFNRWSRRSFWPAMLVGPSRGRMVGRGRRHRGHLRRSLGARGQRGAKGGQGAGPSARRAVDRPPRTRARRCAWPPRVLLLTPGNASNVRTAPEVLADAPGRVRRLIADRGYDAD